MKLLNNRTFVKIYGYDGTFLIQSTILVNIHIYKGNIAKIFLQLSRLKMCALFVTWLTSTQ